jgi:hypothetical protein
MSDPSQVQKQVEVSHREAAEGRLSRARDPAFSSRQAEADAIPTALAEAQVHASLAIAEQLERLNDQLAEVIDPIAGGAFPGVVRVRTEGTEG